MAESESDARILVVDDEPAITGALARKLKREGFDCLTASSGEEALELVSSKELDVVITDVRMPDVDGLDVLKGVKGRDPAIQVIMMTAYTDIGYAVEALRHKADDYLLKPFNMAELSHCVRRSLEHRRLLLANRAYMAVSGGKAGEAEQRNSGFLQAIAALATAIESRDLHTRGHLAGVARYALATASELGLAENLGPSLWLGAILHDVGMLTVPESIINKRGPLTPEEWAAVHQHPVAGGAILRTTSYLRPAHGIAGEHHERVDGSGYPAGLAGDEISLEARIVAISDAFAAMRSRRAHRPAIGEAETLSIIEGGAGVQFDEECVRAFLSAQRKGFPLEEGGLEIPELPSSG
ncbi:MAG: response regulator [Gemmatimonadota bacterium]|nr:MAG: response regulator [Gemmatimonadota bacterium]